MGVSLVMGTFAETCMFRSLSPAPVLLVQLEVSLKREVKKGKEKYRVGETVDMRMGNHSCVLLYVSLLF